jgi:hypothetical protein
MFRSGPALPLLAIFLLLGGCVNAPLTNETAQQLAGRNLSISTRAPFNFEARTRGAEFAGSLFGIVGASIASGTFASQGAQFAASNGISDPSNDLAMRIGLEMRDKHKLSLAADRPVMTSRSDSGVASELTGRDLLLDIHPLAWGYTYYNRDPQ